MPDPPNPTPAPDETECLRRELDLDVQRGQLSAADAHRFAATPRLAPPRTRLRARCRLAVERALPFVEVRMTAAPRGPAVPVDPIALLRSLRAWSPAGDPSPPLLDVRLPSAGRSGLPEGHAAAPARRVRRGHP